ncbi:DUF922 domain-containing protein [Sphingobium sp. CECT 9361]|uniref:DUF922 domain-containing protein n=1 Tax=Sphingobium sp. CECT 9361 TaxID=2845384 RepID=UPI001E352404|nr:DUF922 domain-containing protein [Sphingobium sp. CECT 9361]
MPACLALLLAMAASAAEQPSRDDLVPSLAGIPNVSLEYYPVSGRTAADVSSAIYAKGLVGEDGKRVDSLSRTDIRWRWKESGGDHCVPLDPMVELHATIILPRLVEEARLPAETRVRWYRYVEALGRHEAGHVRSSYMLVDAVREAIAHSSCAKADAAAAAVAAAFQERDAEYDRATDHGRNQGAIFP